jgi:GNAT superfamily N-acetyltransferase
MSGKLSPPENLSPRHDLSQFSCGEPALDDWLRRRAVQNEASGASRTYVVRAGKRVAGFYSLAVGAVAHDGLSGRIKRNMPDPVPVMILARLAVDESFQRQGIGPALLADAIYRTVQAAAIAGIRTLLVHAISERAKRFYEAHGFRASPLDPMTLMTTLTEAQAILGEKGR